MNRIEEVKKILEKYKLWVMNLDRGESLRCNQEDTAEQINQLYEPQPRLKYPDCCIGCEYAYKNEALQIDCACLHNPPTNCHLNEPQPDQSRICPECKGEGGWASRQDDPEPPTECLKCGGTGKLPDQSSRLLTADEQIAAMKAYNKYASETGDTRRDVNDWLCEAQRDLTASIKDRRIEELDAQILACQGVIANLKESLTRLESEGAARIEALIESRKGDYKMLADWVDRCEVTLSDTNMSNALVRDGLLNISKYLKANPTSEVEG